MALRFLRSVIIINLVIARGAALPASRALALGALPAGTALPTLATFTRSIENGRPDQLRGAYAPGLFALEVVQQPSGDVGFISSEQDFLTEFQLAPQLGSLGLLAHNYLAGARFALVEPGQVIYLVYGDGRTAAYITRSIERFQALQPRSAYSAFVDLSDGRPIGAADLFSSIYGRQRSLVLQTCIESEGMLTWGRLFVIAQPLSRHGPEQGHCLACE